jgi:hypothetical protein
MRLVMRGYYSGSVVPLSVHGGDRRATKKSRRAKNHSLEALSSYEVNEHSHADHAAERDACDLPAAC